MGIPWDGMGWDRHNLLWDGMGWDRKICPMDKPGHISIKLKNKIKYFYWTNILESPEAGRGYCLLYL